MNKSKVDFIADLLSEKRLNASDKEKLFQLASKELASYSNLEERIKTLEYSISSNKEEQEIDRENRKEKKTGNKNEYIDPYYLYQFLFQYNQNKILKSTCHELDEEEIEKINAYCGVEEYSFESHLQKIKEAYETHDKSYFAPRQVKTLIRGYLTGKDYNGNKLSTGWSTDKVSINWSSPDLIDWTKNNPGVPPNLSEDLMDDKGMTGFEFSRKYSSVLGDSFQTFTQLVLHFKYLFHIRYENSLKKIIESFNENKGLSKNIKFYIDEKYFPKGIELFTDIDKLIQSYDKIIEKILFSHNYDTLPEVSLKLYQNENWVRLSIHHVNNTFRKPVSETVDRLGEFYDSLIYFQINGLCNLYLNAKFGDGECARINLWDAEERSSEQIDEFQGVEHVLEFRKKPSR